MLASFVANIGRDIGWATESGTVGVYRARSKSEGGKDVDGERVVAEERSIGERGQCSATVYKGLGEGLGMSEMAGMGQAENG